MVGWLINVLPFNFYFLVFFVPLVLYPYTSELFEFNKLILVYILTVLIAVGWILKMIVQKKIIFRRTILDIPLLVFLGSQLISTLLSIDFRTSLLGYYSRFHGGFLSYLSYSLLYWAYVSNMDAKKTAKVILALMVSAALVSIYGILEHFGIDKNIWIQDVQNRVFSALGQPNWLAAWLVALLPLTWKLKSKPRLFWLWMGISSLFFLTLLFTKSRSGILGFATAEIIFWPASLIYLLKKKAKLKSFVRKFIFYHLAFIVIGLMVGTPWTPSLADFIKNRKAVVNTPATQTAGPALEVGGTESGTIRKIVWKGALEIWKHYPVFGTGVETFAFSYYNFRPAEHNLVSEWDFLYNKAHNEYLNFAATTGSVGLLAYLFLAGMIVLLLLKKHKPGLLASFGSILVTNFFGFSVVPVAVLFFLYPAFAIALMRESERVEEYKPKKITNVQKIGILLSCSLALLLFYSIYKYWYADILYAKGKNFDDANNYSSGYTILTQAVSLSSKEAIYWDELSQSEAGLAVAFAEAGQKDRAQEFGRKAVADLNRALALAPKNLNIKRHGVSLFIKLMALDPLYLNEAKNILLSTIELAPTDAKLFYNLGLIYARAGKEDEAIRTLEKTISLKPNYKEARVALALLYSRKSQKQKAEDELLYILEKIDPNDASVRRDLEELK